ncbi:signal recognition particle, SRP9/SRP14 subunit [Daldinia caldariorum]|uniref:signal recognition particle, SRP9/SRP14 subunit n=1 Tax=Daldinia caldariorum TaxID=326644 RepID=UPI002007A57A|nr:signal recognition particle, SRP9/SRP14 subunit [Daldinia caldariorum]KAI1462965.1 signal recognition particle, SRP9/SRP14 subunit [Daldinia caldariorum]
MGHLNNDEFFLKLTELFDQKKGKDHGSIVLVQKRLSYDQPVPEPTSETVLPDLHPPQPMPVLIRATNAKGKKRREDKIKLSTVVEPDALPAFFDRYAEVCKAGMATLKPRDRSKRKGKAKKKKGSAAPSGP